MIPDARPVQVIKAGNLLYNRSEYEHLFELGLYSFDGFFNPNGGTLIKKIPERSVIRIPIPEARGGGAYFLKIHRAERSSARNSSQGRIEFENILAFRKKRIGTVIPAAMGERFVNDSGRKMVESFIATRDFTPFIPLEALLEKRPEIFKDSKVRAALLQGIGILAAKMHRAGFNHRDFNATHILLRYPEPNESPELALYDLQRVDRKKLFRFRWIIKSLAEIGYTLPNDLFSEPDLDRLLLCYKGKEKFSPWDRFQCRWIRGKRERIARHTEKIMVRRKKEGRISRTCAEINR